MNTWKDTALRDMTSQVLELGLFYTVGSWSAWEWPKSGVDLLKFDFVGKSGRIYFLKYFWAL